MPKSSRRGANSKLARQSGVLTPEHARRVKGGKLPGMRKPTTLTLKRG